MWCIQQKLFMRYLNVGKTRNIYFPDHLSSSFIASSMAAVSEHRLLEGERLVSK